ncbi:MAG: hypothetical protein EOS06_30745 [Mesorhizobium sp.]|nr:MAG: hypothetical protein EOS06_30745 [Mesorhizobium sp.]
MRRERIIESTFVGRVEEHTMLLASLPSSLIEGSAYITGFNTITLHETSPFAGGFLLAQFKRRLYNGLERRLPDCYHQVNQR